MKKGRNDEKYEVTNMYLEGGKGHIFITLVRYIGEVNKMSSSLKINQDSYLSTFNDFTKCLLNNRFEKQIFCPCEAQKRE